MIGLSVSHYSIVEKLGEGGMGIVYKALDTKLNRPVALKFLPPHVTSTEANEARLIQEARAAAALNHPNVCHINRIDEVDAPAGSGRVGEKLLFIEMEFVDGLTLRKAIAGRPMPMADALAVATQIGEALQEAHAQGIIHRDIKAENIMVNARGQVKVMDFGLARLKGALKLTRSSSTVGTLAYMSPEQIQGAEADARADIFSFGVVLYETLTGRVPFEGAHEAALMYSILNTPPTPLEKYVPDAPGELLHIINRALEKDPADRYQSVGDMVIDIRRLRKDSTRLSQTIPIPGTVPAGQSGQIQRPEPASSGTIVTPSASGTGSFSSGATSSVPTATSSVPGATSSVSGATSSGHITAPPSAAAPSGPVSGQSDAPPRRSSSVTIPIPSGKGRWIAVAALVVVIGGFIGYLQFGPDAGAGGGKLSVAVADFVNQTGEPELDGLSGMLTTAMEQSQRLSIVTRSHMFDILKQMGNADADRIDEALGKQICSRAGIGALVTASIRKLGKLYVIDLKVVDPSKNEYIFTAKEEGEGQEKIPEMLDNLSEKTRTGLRDRIDETGGGENLAKVTTSNLEAYQHFFEGDQHLSKLEIPQAKEEFRKAVALDSTFALAWYRLAYAINWTSLRSENLNDALGRAMALIDRLPDKERYMVRALEAVEADNFDEGVRILREMETKYPNDKEMIYNIGDWSYHDIKLDAAATYLSRTVEMDPHHSRGLQHLVWTYRDLGQYAKMIETAKKYVDVAENPESYQLLHDAYVLTGAFREGADEFLRLRTLHPTMPMVSRYLAYLYQMGGESEKADEANAQLLASADSATAQVGRGTSGRLLQARGQYRELKKLVAEEVAEAVRKKDTSRAVTVLIESGFLEANLGRSPERAAAILKRVEAYGHALPPQSIYPRTILSIYIDPVNAEVPPPLLGELTGRGMEAIRRALAGECETSSAMIDSLAGPSMSAFFRFGYAYAAAECHLKAGRYRDAMASIEHALAEKTLFLDYLYGEGLLTQGKIHEAMGDRGAATAVYDRLLKRLAKADPDLPLLVETKALRAGMKPGA